MPVHWQNLVVMFFEQAERFGERPFLWRKREGRFQPVTWREVAARVTSLARGLRQLGLSRGDRIVLVAENRPAWLIADVAVMAAGGITVPAYTTNTEADHLHILENSGARGAIVSSRKLAGPLLAAIERAPAAEFLVSIEPVEAPPSVTSALHTWKDVIARGDRDHTNIIAAAGAFATSDTACLIYTSGTGGAPKGVELHHGAILHNCAGAAEVLAEVGDGTETFLSFLPLSHAYEHTTGQYLPMAIGGEIYYAEGVDKVVSNIVEARPTILSAVPRFYEIMHQRITHEVRRVGGWRERLFLQALRIGRQRYRQPESISLIDRVFDRALDPLVRDRLRARFGGRLKAMVSGGAPLNADVGIFFTALGIPMIQGYGQTEAGPLISVNRISKPKIDTVGPPLTGVEVKIADDGEILVRGPMVMKGYWQNEEATRETLRDGWLHTGDIGEVDGDGCIRITDRKRDIIVVSGGDNISPARIEGLLTLRPEIGQAMVYGDRRPHLVALLVPEADWLHHWARRQGKPLDLKALADDPDLRRALSEAVEDVNGAVSVIERIRKFAVLAEPFTIDNEQLTPTMKIRRHVIRKVYGDLLTALYD
jgi:long-chain acyl-CoA synthetase